MFLKKFNIGIKWVQNDDLEGFKNAIDDRTKAIYVESIGNPKYNVAPLPELAKVFSSYSYAPLMIYMILFRSLTMLAFLLLWITPLVPVAI